MSNIPVKRSFTASTETYDTHITAPKLIRGLFLVSLYIIYSENTNKMLAHFTNASNSYLRNFLRNSKRIVHDESLTLYILLENIITIIGTRSQFRLISILNSNGSSLLLYI